jgi:hypothetical protein
VVKGVFEVTENREGKPQSVPLGFTEEQIKLAREGKSTQVFEEILAQTERSEALQARETEMVKNREGKPQSVPLGFTEEQIKLAREGKSTQVFEEILAQTERSESIEG